MGDRITYFKFLLASEQVNLLLQEVAQRLEPEHGDWLFKQLPWKPHRDRYHYPENMGKAGVGIAGLQDRAFGWFMQFNPTADLRSYVDGSAVWQSVDAEGTQKITIELYADLEVGLDNAVFQIQFAYHPRQAASSDRSVREELISICESVAVIALVESVGGYDALLFPETRELDIDLSGHEYVTYDFKTELGDVDAYVEKLLDQIGLGRNVGINSAVKADNK